MKEQNIERYLVRNVTEIGGKAWKFVSPGMNGVPDRMILLPGGRIVFVELKTKKGNLSRIQQLRIKQLQELGFQVEVLNSREKVEWFIKEVVPSEIHPL